MPSIKYSCMISLVATVTDWISLHGLDLLLTGSQLENASNIILSCTRHLRWNHFAEKFGWHLHLLFAVRMLQNQITRWRNMINRVYMKFTFSIFFLSVYQFPERCFETYYTVQAKHCQRMWNYWHCSYENQRITELVFGKYILGTQFNQKAMVLLQSLLFLHLDMIRQKYFNSPTNVHVTSKL